MIKGTACLVPILAAVVAASGCASSTFGSASATSGSSSISASILPASSLVETTRSTSPTRSQTVPSQRFIITGPPLSTATTEVHPLANNPAPPSPPCVFPPSNLADIVTNSDFTMDVIVPAALVSVAPTVITDAASVGHHPGYFEYTFSNPAAVVAAKAPPWGT